MIKNILLLLFAAIISFCAPTFSRAQHIDTNITTSEFQDINISVVGSNVHITGANGQTLFVYNVAGMCVASFKVEGSDRHYELNLPKGCYILKVGDTVRKVSLK